MPDVLGISQDALCPDASCERAQNETGTAEPCEHQLDLLVVSALCLKFTLLILLSFLKSNLKYLSTKSYFDSPFVVRCCQVTHKWEENDTSVTRATLIHIFLHKKL